VSQQLQWSGLYLSFCLAVVDGCFANVRYMVERLKQDRERLAGASCCSPSRFAACAARFLLVQEPHGFNVCFWYLPDQFR
jgi:hypothetical protein